MSGNVPDNGGRFGGALLALRHEACPEREKQMVDTAALRKARGAFFTPVEITDFLAEWAIRSPSDTVLEPSCGEAGFLISATERLRELGATEISPEQMRGLDIHAESVVQAKNTLLQLGIDPMLEQGNFFDLQAAASKSGFDAVIGNPPYVRYQEFAGEARAKGQRAALAQGVRLPGLASSWAAFTVHAASFLNATGRLALVLPAELLSVNYAGPVRRYLLERFAHVHLIVFETRVFPGVLEEVVLLLAEGAGAADHFEVYQARDCEDLNSSQSTNWFPVDSAEKWLPALLPPRAAECYKQALTREAFGRLQDWGETDLGMVTGNNNFFTLSPQRVRQLGLGKSAVMPISPPSSRHLRGLSFTSKTWQEMGEAGAHVYLFDPPVRSSITSERYIKYGEAQGVHRAYKCRVRTPWWRVPKVQIPDLFLTYMNHDTPRLVANRAQVPHLNSVHGVTLFDPYKIIGKDLLPIASLNSITLLGAELVGRPYGGGILKLEPKEADRLPLPTPTTVHQAAPALRALRGELSALLKRKDLRTAVSLVDRALLIDHIGYEGADINSLVQAQEKMFARRRAGGKPARG